MLLIRSWNASTDISNGAKTCPPVLTDSALAERLDAMLEWRDLVDQLSLADLPRGFGRD